MTQIRIKNIEKRIEKIKASLSALGEMRPGTLSLQYKDPENAKGPYYQLSYTLNKRSRTDYVSEAALKEVRSQVANYKTFKELTAEWVELSVEHARLKKALKQS